MPSSNDSSNRKKPERLYQEHPRRESKYPGLKSKNESLESYRRDATREAMVLKLNGTVPDHIIQLNYFVELSVKEIQTLWARHSRRLRDNGVVAYAAMEITKDKWRQRPINRVHYHIIAKDDRTGDEMEELFEAVCRCEIPLSDFKVHVFPFDEKKGGWKGYKEYLGRTQG